MGTNPSGAGSNWIILFEQILHERCSLKQLKKVK
jgi:hypothetical protein